MKFKLNITRNIITREQAVAICPDYVAFVEGNVEGFDAIFDSFNKARKGQNAITAFGQDEKLIFVRVKISSVNADDPRALDGPVVRVSNGEYSWRVDGHQYAHIL